MISKRVLLLAVALVAFSASGAMAAGANVGNFNVAQLSIGPSDYLNLNSAASYGIVSGTVTTPIPTPYATIKSYILHGYASGAWNGLGGINSSVAASDPNGASALALVSGQDYLACIGTSFHGHAVAASDSLIRYTYYGDANLDGAVSAADYAYFNYGRTHSGVSGWVWGDFNYDGSIDDTDYAYLEYVDSLHLPPLDGTVPEPAALVLMAAGVMGLVFFRRVGKEGTRKVSKGVLLLAAALVFFSATGAMAATVNVGNITVATLSIGPTDSLNLNSTYSYGIVSGTVTTPTPTAFSVIKGYVINGYAGGAWNGVGGINSSVAAADPLHVTALGLVSGADMIDNTGQSTFHGHTVTRADSLIRFTYYGDANMDGVVNEDDYGFINFALQNPGFTGWMFGDFNYDGVINNVDLNIINYVASLHLPPAESYVYVPEPVTLVLFGMAGLVPISLGRFRKKINRMISKGMLLLAVALVLLSATEVVAASVNVGNFSFSQVTIGPTDCITLNSTASYGIVSGTVPTPYATIKNYVKNGYAGGAWNGLGGINSSVAAADPLHVTALGLVSGDDMINYIGQTTFHGHTVAAADSLIRFTYYGDANMDGVVNSFDYDYFDYGYANGLTGWMFGDFNYDGVINSVDYDLLAYVESLDLPNATSYVYVPEPATLVLLGMAGLAWVVLRRRR